MVRKEIDPKLMLATFGAPKLSSDDLAKLCAAYTKPVKRKMHQGYRHMTAAGKLSAPKVECKVMYAKDAYRADKRRAGNCPDYRGWDDKKVRNAAVRDY